MAQFAKRNDYGLGCLSEESCDSNPIRQFEAWLQDAQNADFKEPTAMVLSTIGPAGPSGRVVLLKEVTENGFVFYTNYESAKGSELIAAPYAALDFYWKSLHRQVRVRGSVTQTSAAEADAYFATRPRSAQIGAWASSQSRPLESRFALEKAFAAHAAKNLIGAVPRPPHWSGFRVTPLEIEFWHSRLSRLHERIMFKREAPGANWLKTRLYP